MTILVRFIMSPVFLALIFCQILTGCLGSGIKTVIHKDLHSQVYLEWVKKESFRASHPKHFSPELVRKVLSGLRIQFPQGLVEEMLREGAKPEPVFFDEDVQALVPHVVSAMSQVTPEELVVFERLYDPDSRKRKITGTIYIKDNLLYLTIKALDYKRKGPTITFQKGNRGGEVPDRNGLRDVQFSFFPDSVWRQDSENTSSAVSHSSGKTLVLDYKSLSVS